MPRTATAANVRPQRTRAGSCRAEVRGRVSCCRAGEGRAGRTATAGGRGSAGGASSSLPLSPALPQGDGRQQDKRDPQQYDGQGGCLGGGILFEPGVEQQRGNPRIL